MHFIQKSFISAIDILQVLYANSHPFLIASQTSLEDLNTRLSEAIPMDSFRGMLHQGSGRTPECNIFIPVN